MKSVINALLCVVIVVLAYLCVNSVLTPIKFDEQRAKREAVVVGRLVDIRKAQIEYKKQNGKYTGSLDTLVDFVKNGKVAIVRKEGTLTDEQLEAGLTEKEAIKQGIIRRDTTFKNVKEELFGAAFNADSLRYVPFGNGATFEMAQATLTSGSGVEVPVFEAKTPYSVYLNGLNKQELANITDVAQKLGRFAGLQVGSVDEANNNAGNWE